MFSPKEILKGTNFKGNKLKGTILHSNILLFVYDYNSTQERVYITIFYLILNFV